MLIVAILEAVDVNNARDNYHCTNKPNFVRCYCENHPRRYFARL
jgi:hypothetical protein